MKSEIWESHPDIPGIQVSTLGRVRTLDKVTSSEKYTRFTKGHVLKQCNDKDGYLMVSVTVDGKRTTKKVHRLVAQTFLPNPNGFPMANHKNCVRDDNRVSNLEWCNNSYNQKYREKHGVSQTEAAGHPVFAVNLATLEVLHFRSQHEASRVLGISNGNVNKVIKVKYKQTGGFWFTNADDKADDAIKCKLQEIKKIYS